MTTHLPTPCAQVLFLPNSEFHVLKVVTDHAEKKALLGKLASYNLEDLDVYILRQM